MNMKAIILALGIVVVLGIGAAWLYAAPQSTSTIPPTTAQQANPLSSPQQQKQSSAAPTPTSSVPRPLAITHTVGTATATPAMITVGTSSQVTVTIQITDPVLIPTSVNLIRLGAIGTQPTILAVMRSVGNGTFSLQRVFNEPSAGQIQLQVSAAFQGSLQRVLSNVLVVPVWNLVSISGPIVFSLSIPQDWSAAVQPNITNIFPSNKSFDQNKEYAGDIVIYVDGNPNNLLASDYYNGTNGEDLYSGPPTIIPLTLSGHAAAKYLQSTGIGGIETVVVTLPNYFLRLENRGDDAQFDSIVQSLTIQ
jgi:hypothetical protein